MRHTNFIHMMLLIATFATLSRVATGDNLLATRGQPVVERAHSVVVDVADGYATFTVRRTYENLGDVPEQVELSIILPERTVATGLRIKAQKRWYDGDLMEREMADVVYESLTGYGPFRLKDPALLYWEALGELRLLLFPVKPKSTATIEYTLVQTLPYKGGEFFLKYPTAIDGDNLAVPTISVRPSPHVTAFNMKGRDGVFNKPAAVRNLPSAVPCGDEAVEKKDVQRFCENPGEVLVTLLKKRTTPVLTSRFGTFDLGRGAGAMRFEIDMAAKMSDVPRRPTVVFIIDTSHSFEKEGIKAAIALSSAIAGHFRDAQFEVVRFNRFAERHFSRFVPKKELQAALSKLHDTVEPRNGSNVEAGLSLAGRLLSRRRGPTRVFVITDTLFRKRYNNDDAIRALLPLDGDTVLHLIGLTPEAIAPDDEAANIQVQRDDEHLLSPLPLAWGGVYFDVYGGTRREDYIDATVEMVRPVRIDNVSIRDSAGVLRDLYDMPSELNEGDGLRYHGITGALPSYVRITGDIWATPFSEMIPIDPDYSQSVVPAMIFASMDYQGLERSQMLRAAVAGKVVSPVTSYLAIEPGTRPSREGLMVRNGMGGLGLLGTGRGGGSTGDALPGLSVDYKALLSAQAEQQLEPCLRDLPSDTDITVRIETTLDEVVDVAVIEAPGDKTKQCVEESLWGLVLASVFRNQSRLNVELEF